MHKRAIRTDIQCLRSLAIFGVLAFHLWPEVFPLGYLGVDVLFVISGYLMTFILSRSLADGLTLKVLFNFYNRRAKRILPPYLLAIFGTIFVCQFILSRSDLVDLKEDTIWALGIATNIKTIVKKQQYFASTHLYKFLLHTWSLGLEMQYYVFAPILLHTIAVSSRPLLLISIISGISWASQCLIPDDTVSFGFVGCRLWQFMFGTAAFYISKNVDKRYTLLDDGKSQKQNLWKTLLYTCIVVSLASLVFLPFTDASTVQKTAIGTRFLSTFLAAIIIAFDNETLVIPIPSLISNTLVHIGDISYSVYLVHWPLIILAKYLGIFNFYNAFILIAVIFALGIAQYNAFEKPLSKQSDKVICFSIAALTFACVLLLLNQNVISDLLSNPENDLERNEQLFAQCNQEIQNLHDCHKVEFTWKAKQRFQRFACESEGTGNLTILLTGNSYAMRIYQSLIDSGKHKFKKLIIAAANTCVIHKQFTFNKKYCKDVADGLPLTLAEIRPDIVIVNQRMFESKAFQKPIVKNDETTRSMRMDWAMISNYTKKIIIIEPSGPLPMKRDILKPFRLKEANLSVYDVPLKQYAAEVDHGWDRTIQSINKCPKCKIVEIRKHFCNRELCAAYDSESRMSLYCDPNHHAPTAVKRYMPSIIRELELQ